MIAISVANNNQKTTNKILDSFLSLDSLDDLGILRTGNIPAKAYAPKINFKKTGSVPRSLSIL
jgi:hypothetical protein